MITFFVSHFVEFPFQLQIDDQLTVIQKMLSCYHEKLMLVSEQALTKETIYLNVQMFIITVHQVLAFS